MSDTKRIALFAGSFNPFTKGHQDIVERALAIFDKVIVGVGYNEHKSSVTDAEANARHIAGIYASEPRVESIAYKGLTVETARRLGATALLRGVRDVTDFEYERNLADVNRLISGIETVILFTRPELACISGSMVRELSHNGIDVSRWLASDPKQEL